MMFGLVHHPIHIGEMNQERFAQFLQACAEALHDEETYVIFDGAPPHRQAGSPADHIHLQMLTPCSPFLNIVSSLQAAIKNDICRTEIQQQIQNRQRA